MAKKVRGAYVTCIGKCFLPRKCCKKERCARRTSTTAVKKTALRTIERLTLVLNWVCVRARGTKTQNAIGQAERSHTEAKSYDTAPEEVGTAP